MKKAMFLVLLCGAVLGQAHPLYGQSPIEQAIAASFPLTKATADRTDIVTAGAVMTLKKDNIIMFATTATSRASLNYKDGKVSPSVPTRLAAFSFTGRPATNIVQRTFVAGEKLWLIGVQAAGDGVTLQFLSDPIGDVRYATSIKFPFAKGTTPNSQQIVAQIGEVIAPDGGAASPASSAPKEAPIVAPPPPGDTQESSSAGSAAGAWRLVDQEQGQQNAMIAGQATSNGRSSSAALAVGCSLDPKTGAGNPSAEVRMHLSGLGVKPTIFHGYSDGYDQATVLVGGVKTETVDFNPSYPPDNAKPNQILTFSASITPVSLKALASSPGAPLVLQFNSADLHQVFLTGTFVLPSNLGVAAPVFQTCLAAAEKTAQLAEAAMRKYKSSIVVACPNVANVPLQSVEVLSTTGKTIDSEEGEGDSVWNLPRPTKAHPVAPKLILKCSYGANDGEASAAITVRRLPIPANARECHADGKTGECIR